MKYRISRQLWQKEFPRLTATYLDGEGAGQGKGGLAEKLDGVGVATNVAKELDKRREHARVGKDLAGPRVVVQLHVAKVHRKQLGPDRLIGAFNGGKKRETGVLADKANELVC